MTFPCPYDRQSTVDLKIKKTEPFRFSLDFWRMKILYWLLIMNLMSKSHFDIDFCPMCMCKALSSVNWCRWFRCYYGAARLPCLVEKRLFQLRLKRFSLPCKRENKEQVRSGEQSCHSTILTLVACIWHQATRSTKHVLR